MSFINSEALFHELNGSEMSGFTTLHSPVQHSPAGTPYMVQPGVAVLARPQFNMAARRVSSSIISVDNF